MLALLVNRMEQPSSRAAVRSVDPQVLLNMTCNVALLFTMTRTIVRLIHRQRSFESGLKFYCTLFEVKGALCNETAKDTSK